MADKAVAAKRSTRSAATTVTAMTTAAATTIAVTDTPVTVTSLESIATDVTVTSIAPVTSVGAVSNASAVSSSTVAAPVTKPETKDVIIKEPDNAPAALKRAKKQKAAAKAKKVKSSGKKVNSVDENLDHDDLMAVLEENDNKEDEMEEDEKKEEEKVDDSGVDVDEFGDDDFSEQQLKQIEQIEKSPIVDKDIVDTPAKPKIIVTWRTPPNKSVGQRVVSRPTAENSGMDVMSTPVKSPASTPKILPKEKKKQQKRDTRCYKCKKIFIFGNLRLFQEDGGAERYICKKCEKKVIDKSKIIVKVICTACHQEKDKPQAFKFKPRKYDIRFENVRYALGHENRIIIYGEEWICRVCDYALRPQRKDYHRSFHPCQMCKIGVPCNHKKTAESFLTGTGKVANNYNVESEAHISQILPSQEELPQPSSRFFWVTVLGKFAEKTSYEALERYILFDSDLMSKIPQLPNIEVNKQMMYDKIDLLAAHDMPSDNQLRNPFPICVKPDGNCFVNSLSRIVYGNEDHADEFRVRLTVDAVVNKDKYMDHLTLLAGFDSCVPSDNFVDNYLLYSVAASVCLPSGGTENDLRRKQLYENLTFNVSRDRQWCNIWQFHQAANILQTQVRCIYPELRDRERRVFNRVFYPLQQQACANSRTDVNIMFCRTSLLTGIPNHFVPVVEKNFEIGVDVEETGRSLWPLTESHTSNVLDDDEFPSLPCNKTVFSETKTPNKTLSHTFCTPQSENRKTPSSRRKQITPRQFLNNRTDDSGSSRRKQKFPSKILESDKKVNEQNVAYCQNEHQRHSSRVRKRLLEDGTSENFEDGSYLPMMEDIDTPKKAKKIRKQTNDINPHESIKIGQCTLCHVRGKKMKSFLEGNYNLTKEQKDTVLRSEYRIRDIEGDEVICGDCDIALGKQRIRRNWSYYNENNNISGKCTLCHVTGRRMKGFVEESYDLSEKVKNTILQNKYRIVQSEVGELICGGCDKFLLTGRKRRKWSYCNDARSVARSSFLSALEDLPEYVCTVCHRMMFSSSVNVLNTDIFDANHETVANCLSDQMRKKSMNGIEYICVMCQQLLRLKTPVMPNQAVANKLEVPQQPDVLKDLTEMERRCISLRIPFMTIKSVRQNGRKMKGPCVNVPAKLEAMCYILPRLPDELQTVLIKLKKRIQYDSSYMFDYIRPHKVMEALLWLKAHNPLYKDVEIDRGWLDEVEKLSACGYYDVINSDVLGEGSHEEDDDEKSEMRQSDEKFNNIEMDEISVNERVEDRHEIDGHDDDDRCSDESDFEEEQDAVNERGKITIQPSSTCVQLENVEEAIFSIAPGEGSKPNLILTDEQFEVASYPDYFPLAEGSFNCVDRPRNLNIRRYVNSRLLNVDGKFGRNIEYIFAMQYAVELKQLDTDKNVYIRNHSHNESGLSMNASMLKDTSFTKQLISNDQAYRFMQNVRGTPAYWKNKLYDTLAMFNALGKPTWFLTLSAAEHIWPEMIQAVGIMHGIKYSLDEARNLNPAQKFRLLKMNPVVTVRMWKHRLEAFFNNYVKNHKACPLGKVVDFVVKIEFQARGSPHAHILLWIEDAPHIDITDNDEICNFIDTYLFGHIMDEWADEPNDCTLAELTEIVRKVQVHRHSPMCRASKKAKCRHSFPKFASFKTIITQPELREDLSEKEKTLNREILSAVCDEIDKDPSQTLADICNKCSVSEERYTEILMASDSSHNVILKREPQDIFVNNYNPNLLSLWKANMDIQYCVDTVKCINYLMSYVTKCEKGMSELMIRIKENFKDKSVQDQMHEMTKAFTGKREVSIQESVYRVLSLPLYMKSKNVVFISGDLQGKRDHIPKKKEVIEAMEDDDEDVFEKNIHDRYECRPDELESICLADFGTWYSYKKDKPPRAKNKYIELKDGLGWMIKNTKQSVMRTYKPKRGTDEFCQHQLKLFFPYRKESELLAGYNSYMEHYAEVVEVIEQNSQKYNMFQDEIDEAFIERSKIEISNESSNDWDIVSNVKEHPVMQSELTKKFRIEAKKGKLSPAEYITKVRSSNEKQKELVMWCRSYVKKQIRCMKQGESPEGFKVVLTGAGGTGKSHTISLINHDVIDLFGRTNTIDPEDLFQEGRNPEKPTALLTATTGTAAFNINGSTIHSALMVYRETLSPERSCILQSQLHQLQLLTVDEFSMMGARMLSLLNKRCCFIKQNTEAAGMKKKRNFGNINILLVGDAYQLPAVKQTAIYNVPNIDKLEDFQKPLWRDFYLHELTQIMRQKNRNFADLLSRVRIAPPQANSEDDNALKSRELKLSYEDDLYPKKALHVFAQNDAADFYNEQRLIDIADRRLHICVSNDSVEAGYGTKQPEFSSKVSQTGNLVKVLKVKVGARVILTNNLDVSDGLTNGAFGNITDIIYNQAQNEVKTILVEFDSPEIGQVAKARSKWRGVYPSSVPIERIEAHFAHISGKMVYSASRHQFPLFLSWGVTIHKVQGMTLSEIVVEMDPGKGKFNNGQAYVAFSRVKSFEGLHILNYCLEQIKVEKQIHKEMEFMRTHAIPALPPPNLPSIICDVKVAHLNINGIVKGSVDKAEDMSMDSVIQCADVLCLSETHLSPSKDLTGDFWRNYFVHRQDRNSNGGGVLIAVRKNLGIKIIELPETFIEIVAVEVLQSKKSGTINVFCVYLPPSINKLSAAKEIERLIKSFKSDRCVITGDINEDLLQGRSEVDSMLTSLGFTQHISHATSIYGSLLDHMYVNKNYTVHAEVSETYFSDHDIICAGIDYDK